MTKKRIQKPLIVLVAVLSLSLAACSGVINSSSDDEDVETTEIQQDGERPEGPPPEDGEAPDGPPTEDGEASEDESDE